MWFLRIGTSVKRPRRLILIGSLLVIGLAASTAQSASAFDEGEVNEAASVMGVSADRAQEDLQLQYEAHETIGELIEAGDQVWMDNKAASIHIYGEADPRKAIPQSVQAHVVHDPTPHVFPAVSTEVSAGGCSGKKTGYQYCTPMHSGDRIDHQAGAYSNYCTAGFMVRDYSGNPYLLTAGHCAIWGTTFYSNPVTSRIWKSLEVCEPGPWIGGESPWSGHDAAIFPVNGCGGVVPEIRDFGKNKSYPQEGATNTQFVGEYVCHYGATSLHQCGEQLAVNVPTTINYEESGSGTWVIKETDQICGLGIPGDSGGPVASGVYKGDATGIYLGQGLTSACPNTEDHLWIEQRIFSVLNLFDVYVVTA